jgi:hypothetical protein
MDFGYGAFSSKVSSMDMAMIGSSRGKGGGMRR